MCGRYNIVTDAQAFYDAFQIINRSGEQNYTNYNACPGNWLPVVKLHDDARVVVNHQWGFVPTWIKENNPSFRPINAKSETATQKPYFRTQIRKKRCLVPASGYFEWQQNGVKKPFNIKVKDVSLFAMAGIWDEWQAQGDSLSSYAVLTTAANQRLATIHHRMPVIIHPDNYNAWLDPATRMEQVQDLMQPYPKEDIDFYEVSKRVNNPRNNDSEVLKPA